MKKFIIIALVVALAVLFLVPASLFAHPKGPDTMPAQSINGLHKAVFNVPDFPGHILCGLMCRTGVTPPPGHPAVCD
jgi:hypothetical protein